MKRNHYLILVTLFFSSLLLMTSCLTKDSEELKREQNYEKVVIGYLAGDNNLSWEVEHKLNALQKGMALNRDQCALIVYADYKDKLPEIVKIDKDSIEHIKHYMMQNSASPEIFKEVLEDIVDLYPCDSYGFICFSHASGWLPNGALESPTQFCQDLKSRSLLDDNGEVMDLKEFGEVIRVVFKGEKLDFMLFEMCYMAGIEVLYEFKDLANYIIASGTEMVSEGFVESYPSSLHYLLEPKASVEQFTKAHFDIWNNKSGVWRSSCMSVLATEEADSLFEITREIVQKRKVDFDNVQQFQRYNRNQYTLFFDLEEVIKFISEKTDFERFEMAMKKVVVMKLSTPTFLMGEQYGFKVNSYSGLTTYVEQSCFEALNKSYRTTEWGKYLYAPHY